MTHDDRFEEFVRSAINELDPMPEVPREEMWTRIEAARRFRRPRRRSFQPWVRWGVGLAAMFALGIGLGRITKPDPGAPRVAETSARNRPSAVSPLPYKVAALEHFSRAEVLLTAVSSGTVDPQMVRWASDLLISTQLLLDSPAAQDPNVMHLLQDLELLLVQIAASQTAQRNQAELDLIHHGIEQTDVLPRLRALPANPIAVGT